ncbi:MAG TPA: DNA polymerase III subunit beta [Gammaproteobacteria bacterium]|nr:DNA polymerase III subunit beta [Gammaproteobacteria bacterium]
MKLSLQREALLKALQIISGVIEKKQIKPILANTLLTVNGNHLLLTATDAEIELIGSALIQNVNDSTPVTAPARKLYDICRALPEGTPITLSTENDRLTLQSGSSRFTLATLPAQDYPSIEERNFTTQFTLTQTELRNLLSKTSFAMGQQDVRHYLNGVVFDLNSGTMECMATDGHRFALSKVNKNEIDTIKAKILVPRKSVLELMRLLNADDDCPLTVCVNDHYLRVISDDFTFTSKLIHATLPDYHKLIPQKGAHTVLAQRETLRQALIRVSILSHEKFRSIKWNLKEGQLEITANNPEREEAEEIVPVEYTGNPIEVSFNVMYLLDAISAIDSEVIRWSFSNLDDGVLLEPVAENASSLYVVMPLLVPQAAAA